MLLYPKIEKKVLEKIRPTPEQYRLRDEVVSRVKEVGYEVMRERGLTPVTIELQGSAAKDTWLRGSSDFDIFFIFPPKVGGTIWLKEHAFPALKEVAERLGMKYEIAYSSHPYIKGEYMGASVDLVPCFAIKPGERPISAFDRTPLHTRWVKKQIERFGEEIKDEIRLAKAFLKGIGAYGAETSVGGFSGFSAELLTLAYGGFAELLKAASRWKPPVQIVPYWSTTRAVRNLMKRYRSSVIFLPDPVDALRNVTAAVREAKLGLFAVGASSYISNPSEQYFWPARIDVLKQSVKPPCTLILEIPKTEEPENEDMLLGAVISFAESLRNELRKHGIQAGSFTVKTGSKYTTVKIALPYCMPPKFEVKEGPPYWAGQAAEAFIRSSHGPCWIENGRVWCIKERKEKNIGTLVNSILKKMSLKYHDLGMATVMLIPFNG